MATEKKVKEIPSGGEAILRFEDVNFYYNENRPILHEASFVVRKGLRLTLMGPNGAGKSTLFSMITGNNQPQEGRVIIGEKEVVAIANQYIPHDKWEMTVKEFLQLPFKETVYDIEKRATPLFETLGLVTTMDKKIKDLSGGQKGRLLIAQALVQKPTILLLDEPTNNLDKPGIKMLTELMNNFAGTAIMISHDEHFLNEVSHGILYINTQTQKVEQYAGNYFKALDEIKRKVEAEQRANAQLEKEIQDKKDKVNFFALKGGKMRKLASKLRDDIEEAEDNKVEVRKEDRTIRKFKIPAQEDLGGVLLSMKKVEVLHEGKKVLRNVDVEIRKGEKLQIIGPNGVGKTTLLEMIAKGTLPEMMIKEDVLVGYYRQDFSTLDFNKTAYDELAKIFKRLDDQHLRSTASGFLLGGKELSTKIGALSEGQKGLLMWAYLTLEKPGILIIDEPTNHINFRHIPLIQEAIKNFEGAVIVVSHVNDFVRGLNITNTLDLGKL